MWCSAWRHRKCNQLFSWHYPGNTSQKFSRWQNRLRGNKRPKKTALHGTTTKTASIGKSRINSQSRVARTCLRTSRMHSRRKVAKGILQKYISLSTTFVCSPLLLANLSKRVKLGSWSVQRRTMFLAFNLDHRQRCHISVLTVTFHASVRVPPLFKI